MGLWEVVGGSDKGGIVVREGQSATSPQADDRLSTGAVIEEIAMAGDRLHYKLIEGTGPVEGWVSIKIKTGQLCVEKEEDVGGPAEAGGEVEVDAALRKQIEESAEVQRTADAFHKYCMKYKMFFKYPLQSCKLRVFCFPNAGSTESNYTQRSPFTIWAKEVKDVEICALDYPGRNKLLEEEKHTSAETLAPLLLAVMYDKITDGIPYVVWGHSTGSWVSFEVCMLARKCGLPLPIAAFWMAFPGPHMPPKLRNWHKSARLDDKGLKEELMNWDKAHFTGPGRVIFTDEYWGMPTGQGLIRSDFRIFDEYSFKHAGEPKFDFPVHAFHFENEHYNKPDQVELWGAWTTNKFDYRVLAGIGHLECFSDQAKNKEYFTAVTECLKEYHSSL